MFDIGVDLAWGDKAPTGLAVVDADGRLRAVTQVRSDAEILAWLQPWSGGDCLVAIDAPLVVRNATGARECERLVGRYFSRFNASCHSANTGNPAFAGGTRGGRLAAMLGLGIDPATVAARRAVEVYPHPALVSLFDLPTVLTYKDKPGRDLEHLRGQTLQLIGLLESLATADVPLEVAACPDWARIRHVVSTASIKADLRRVEDALDAVVCGYVARLYRHAPGRVRVLGTVADGYILTPVTREIATAVDADRAAGFAPAAMAPSARRPGSSKVPASTVDDAEDADPTSGCVLLLDVDVHYRPATFATAGERAWQAAVRAAVAAAVDQTAVRDTRFGVRITFRLGPSRHPGEVWDLDNLVKPTVDALDGVLGARPGRHACRQPDDERVDYLQASKRPATDTESPGARIRVYDLEPVSG
jgi:predicted RNase H-like nuclease